MFFVFPDWLDVKNEFLWKNFLGGLLPPWRGSNYIILGTIPCRVSNYRKILTDFGKINLSDIFVTWGAIAPLPQFYNFINIFVCTFNVTIDPLSHAWMWKCDKTNPHNGRVTSACIYICNTLFLLPSKIK